MEHSESTLPKYEPGHTSCVLIGAVKIRCFAQTGLSLAPKRWWTPKTMKPKKATSGQKEMLLPIAGKEATKEGMGKMPAAIRTIEPRRPVESNTQHQAVNIWTARGAGMAHRPPHRVLQGPSGRASSFGNVLSPAFRVVQLEFRCLIYKSGRLHHLDWVETVTKFIAYFRVSTERQGKSGLGLAAQHHKIAGYVAGAGTLIAEFCDIQSGKDDSRMELQKAIQLAKRQNAKIVIARIDRFSGRVSFIASILDQGIALVCAEMPNASDFQLHIFAALAQEERGLISERTKAALAEAIGQLDGVLELALPAATIFHPKLPGASPFCCRMRLKRSVISKKSRWSKNTNSSLAA
jgi:hypothetical protein